VPLRPQQSHAPARAGPGCNRQHIDTNVGVSFSPSPRPPILSPCPRLLDTVAYPAHFFAIAMCFQTRVCPHPDPSLSPFISPLSPFPTHQVSMLLLSVRWSGSVPPNSLRHFFPAVFSPASIWAHSPPPNQAAVQCRGPPSVSAFFSLLFPPYSTSSSATL